MPVGDLTGAASNYLGVTRLGTQIADRDRQNLVGAFGQMTGDLGDAFAEHEARSQMTKALQDAGLDPALARDPHTAATALLNKHREDLQRTQGRATAGALGIEKTGVDMGDVDPSALSEMARQGHADAAATTAFGRSKEMDAEREKNDLATDLTKRGRDTEEDKRLGSEIGGLIAPQMDIMPTGPAGNPNAPMLPMGARPATEEDVTSRFAKKPGSASALSAAQGAVRPRFKPGGLSPFEESRQRAAGAAAGTPPKSVETPEAKTARIEREAEARARGTNKGGGDPVTNELKNLTKTMKERDLAEHESPDVKRGKEGLDRAERNLQEFKDRLALTGALDIVDPKKAATRLAELEADVKAKRDAIGGSGTPAKGAGPTEAELAEMDAAGMKYDPATGTVVPK